MPTPVPTSTYRLHLTHAFTLQDAADLVDHVDRLGADWVYASPIQRVPEGATHGYHVLEPDVVDPQLGGEEALATLHGTLAARDRGLLLDIVPNHMGAHPDNPWWDDLLRHGPESVHAATFDVALGDPDDPRPIVLPVLGGPLEEVLAAGEITVDASDPDDPRLVVHGGLRLPLAPGTDPDAPLEDVLAAQHYQLHHWVTGQHQLNWRRFFAINELVGVRVEDPEVFDRTHGLILRLVRDGIVQGLRVDHIDGLADPQGYLDRLHDAVGDDAYLLVEKILDLDEDLRGSWPVAGTTGYEINALLSAWLTDRDGYHRLVDAYYARTPLNGPVSHDLAASKHLTVGRLFPAELDTVVGLLPDVNGVGEAEVRHVLRDMTSHLRGYRTYIRLDGPIDEADHQALEAAAEAAAVTHGRDVAHAVLHELTGPDGRRALIRWQQLTGPTTAKGFEDRLLYRHVALSSLCEVGADAHLLDDPPDPADVQARLAERQRRWPHAGTTTSTHDTKRSEDVRARIAVLAEVPDRFIDLVDHLREATADEPAWADPGLCWLLLQQALGTWGLVEEGPDLADRLADYAAKAADEGDWAADRDGGDAAQVAADARAFAESLTRDPAAGPIARLAEEIAVPGAANGLATLILKLVGPGVPDIYRGTEIWDDSLVDPDNRRPLRVAALRDAARQVADDLAAGDRADAVAGMRKGWRDGRIKLLVTQEGLHLRRAHPEVFLDGPLEAPHVEGTHAAHVAALRRRSPDAGPTAVLGVATRLPWGLAGREWPVGDVWEDTVVDAAPGGTWTDLLTGRSITAVDGHLRLAEVLSVLPVAMLVGHART